MKCPYCGFEDSKVTDSRAADDGVRRRRECLSCGERFTTYERLQRDDLYIVKRDGRREEFDREKLIAGLRPACHKRPIAAGVVDAIADDIEAQVRVDGRPEVPSRELGEMVMSRLRDLDEIAYIRFASVYHRFGDIDDVKREVEALESRAVTPPPQLPLIPTTELQQLARQTELRIAGDPGATRSRRARRARRSA